MFRTISRLWTAKLTTKVLGLFALAVALTCPQVATADEPSAMPRVRILLVADTLGDPSGNLGIDLNRDNLEKVFRSTLQKENLAFTLDILEGMDVTPANILKYYRELDVRSSDTLVFYYSGHAGTDYRAGHVLTTTGGFLVRSELRDAMLAKKARLTILLSDSCAGHLSGSPLDAAVRQVNVARSTNRLSSTAKKAPMNGSFVRQLLMEHRGVIDINGATTGTLGFGRRTKGGSFLTLALVQLLTEKSERFDADGDGFVNWTEFFSVLRTTTERVSLLGENHLVAQVPQAYSLLAEPVQNGDNAFRVAFDSRREGR